jgi:hypothetical protein
MISIPLLPTILSFLDDTAVIAVESLNSKFRSKIVKMLTYPICKNLPLRFHYYKYSDEKGYEELKKRFLSIFYGCYPTSIENETIYEYIDSTLKGEEYNKISNDQQIEICYRVLENVNSHNTTESYTVNSLLLEKLTELHEDETDSVKLLALTNVTFGLIEKFSTRLNDINLNLLRYKILDIFILSVKIYEEDELIFESLSEIESKVKLFLKIGSAIAKDGIDDVYGRSKKDQYLDFLSVLMKRQNTVVINEMQTIFSDILLLMKDLTDSSIISTGLEILLNLAESAPNKIDSVKAIFNLVCNIAKSNPLLCDQLVEECLESILYLMKEYFKQPKILDLGEKVKLIELYFTLYINGNKSSKAKIEQSSSEIIWMFTSLGRGFKDEQVLGRERLSKLLLTIARNEKQGLKFFKYPTNRHYLQNVYNMVGQGSILQNNTHRNLKLLLEVV